MKFRVNGVLLLTAVCASILVAAYGCKKSNNDASGEGLSATVNGSPWASSNPASGVYFRGGNDFDIVGAQVKSGDTTGMELIFATPVILNKPVNSDTSQVVVGYSDYKSASVYSGSAHVLLTITSYDSAGSMIGGTFSGILYNIDNQDDSLVITDGKFNARCQVQ